MKTLWSSPCSRAGLSSESDPFPCTHGDGGAGGCPMNAAERAMLRQREAEMYRLGYTYGAWVVRLDMLGLFPVCSLTYFREKPTAGELQAAYGNRLLHIVEAVPPAAANDDDGLDLEVFPDAAD